MSQPALLRSTYALLGLDLLQAIETHGEYVEEEAGLKLFYFLKSLVDFWSSLTA